MSKNVSQGVVEGGGLLEGMLKEGGSIGRGREVEGGRKGVSPAVDRRLATHKPACAPSRSEQHFWGF